MSISLNGKPALIVNECQLGVIDARYTGFPGLAEQVEARGIVQRIARLAEAFRSRGLPVIHAPLIHRPDFADIQANSLINALTLQPRRMAAGSIEPDSVDALRPFHQAIVINRPAGPP